MKGLISNISKNIQGGTYFLGCVYNNNNNNLYICYFLLLAVAFDNIFMYMSTK